MTFKEKKLREIRSRGEFREFESPYGGIEVRLTLKTESRLPLNEQFIPVEYLKTKLVEELYHFLYNEVVEDLMKLMDDVSKLKDTYEVREKISNLINNY